MLINSYPTIKAKPALLVLRINPFIQLILSTSYLQKRQKRECFSKRKENYSTLDLLSLSAEDAQKKKYAINQEMSQVGRNS